MDKMGGGPDVALLMSQVCSGWWVRNITGSGRPGTQFICDASGELIREKGQKENSFKRKAKQFYYIFILSPQKHVSELQAVECLDCDFVIL